MYMYDHTKAITTMRFCMRSQSSIILMYKILHSENAYVTVLLHKDNNDIICTISQRLIILMYRISQKENAYVHVLPHTESKTVGANMTCLVGNNANHHASTIKFENGTGR